MTHQLRFDNLTVLMCDDVRWVFVDIHTSHYIGASIINEVKFMKGYTIPQQYPSYQGHWQGVEI